ncbi:MAG TPA: VWA domain-containing protein [Patescibacteria group bacterium]|jgi:Ca-activated chloride channel family protein|nr:VWA domain-containing protein [Patescibacteria group bacterium]
MIRFASGWLLFALAIVPLVALAHWLTLKRSRGSVRMSDVSLVKGTRASVWTRLRHAPIVLRLAALSLLLVAFARPQAGSSQEEILTRGIDIMLVMDNSTSMAAEDFKPRNRLAVARSAVASFIQGRKNDRIGLVVFAGRGYTRCPLTLDYDILQQLLGNVDLATQDEGTAIGMGLVTAINRLRDSDAKSRVIVLLTDGRNNRGEIDPSTAASLAQSLGIKVYTIGVGTRGEAPYPIQDPFFGKRYVYLRADIDDETLTEIAKQTGGQYFRATDAESLVSIFKQIDGMEKTDIKVRHYLRYTEMFGWLLLPGAVLLFAEIGLATTRLRRLP